MDSRLHIFSYLSLFGMMNMMHENRQHDARDAADDKDDRRRVSRSHHGRTSNAARNFRRAPACRLPDELLGYVFYLNTLDDAQHVRTVSQVCQRWRTSALNSALLWTTLSIRANPSTKTLHPPLPAIRLQLERSRNAPLALSLTLLASLPKGDLEELVSTLEPHWQRCRAISIETLHPTKIFPLKGDSMDDLRRLRVAVPGGALHTSSTGQELELFRLSDPCARIRLAELDVSMPMMSRCGLPGLITDDDGEDGLLEKDSIRAMRLVDVRADDARSIVEGAQGSLETLEWVQSVSSLPTPLPTGGKSRIAIPSSSIPSTGTSGRASIPMSRASSSQNSRQPTPVRHEFSSLRSLALTGHAPLSPLANGMWGMLPSLESLVLLPASTTSGPTPLAHASGVRRGSTTTTNDIDTLLYAAAEAPHWSVSGSPSASSTPTRRNSMPPTSFLPRLRHLALRRAPGTGAGVGAGGTGAAKLSSEALSSFLRARDGSMRDLEWIWGVGEAGARAAETLVDDLLFLASTTASLPPASSSHAEEAKCVTVRVKGFAMPTLEPTVDALERLSSAAVQLVLVRDKGAWEREYVDLAERLGPQRLDLRVAH